MFSLLFIMYYVTWSVPDPSVLAGDPSLAFDSFEDALVCAHARVLDGTFESLSYETFTVPESIHL